VTVAGGDAPANPQITVVHTSPRHDVSGD